MGKAINALVNRADEENDSYNPNVVRLSCVDVLHPKGSRDRAIVKKTKRDPQTKIVTAVREVTYLYDKDKTSKGWEIVEEVSVSLSMLDENDTMMGPAIVEEVTRDCRTKSLEVEQQEE
jgi:hypothetical protein